MRHAFATGEHFEGDGAAFFAAAVKHQLEGIVSKYAMSRYRSGPSKTWLKIKNTIEGEFILLKVEKDREGVPLAHLARPAGGYAGTAFLTLAGNERRKLVENPATNIRVRVRHLQGGGLLRHAAVRSILQ
jgi:hypothetical protein